MFSVLLYLTPEATPDLVSTELDLVKPPPNVGLRICLRSELDPDLALLGVSPPQCLCS
jgi:hypothetical protein